MIFPNISGPSGPKCTFGSMVTSPTGDGVILLGCIENPEAIYQMTTGSNGEFYWTEMKQKLKYPRTGKPIVAYIDDDLVSCH